MSIEWMHLFDWQINHFGSLIENLRQTWEYRAGFYSWLIKNCGLHLKVLEAGCGIGIAAMTLQGLGYYVTGVDVDEGGIRFAREVSKLLCPKLNLVCVNIYDLPVVPAYGLVTSSGVIEHVSRVDALKMICRLKALSNRFVMVDVPRVRHTKEEDSLAPIEVVYDERSLKQLLKDAGLHIESSYVWGQTVAVLAKVWED